MANMNPRGGLVSDSPFAAVRARWLPLVALGTMVALVVVTAVVGGVFDVSLDTDEALAAMLYLPLIGWTLWVAWRHQIRLRVFFRWPRIGRYWWVVLGMTLALFAFSIGAGNITSALFPDYTASAEVTTDPGFAVLFISLVVLPPLVEEVIFRGMLLERWAAKWRLGVAIIVQAVAFGVLHVDPVGAGMFGVVMALMYLRTRSLWVPIVMHALNNGTVLAFVFLVGDSASEQEPPGLIEALIAGTIFMAISLPFLILFLVRNWPDARTLTPYEVSLGGTAALPPRHIGPVRVVEGPFDIAGRSGRLWLDPDRLLVIADRRGRQTLTAAPWGALHSSGVSPDARVLRIVARDGTVVALELPQRSMRIRVAIAAAVADRIEAARQAPVAVAPPDTMPR